jgi:uncharacterized SAM-binding protein YcdF (DUF218 family)
LYFLSEFIRIIVSILAIIGSAALLVAFLLLDFLNRSSIDRVSDSLPHTAIVFTGDFGRVRLGLDLLSTGRVEQLFITGVNGDAGLNTARFAQQFNLSSLQAAWIRTGKLVLAEDAHNTLENALEAGCWLDNKPNIDAVVLITSRSHMARASTALERRISPINVSRVISDPEGDYDPLLLNLKEFGEFAATWLITLFPPSLWPGNVPTICQVNLSSKGVVER